MKKAIVVAIVLGLVASGAMGASLINDGDFESQSQIMDGSYTAGSSPYGVWLGSSVWQKVYGNLNGIPNTYASHSQYSDVKLVQAFDATSAGITTGTPLRLTFDYILQDAYNGNVSVVGLNNGQRILTYGGGAVEGDMVLSPQDLEETSGWVRGVTHNMTVHENYDSLAVVFTFSADTEAARGVDNVNLEKGNKASGAIPEPVTLVGLAVALGGIGGYMRQRRRGT